MAIEEHVSAELVRQGLHSHAHLLVLLVAGVGGVPAAECLAQVAFLSAREVLACTTASAAMQPRSASTEAGVGLLTCQVSVHQEPMSGCCGACSSREVFDANCSSCLTCPDEARQYQGLWMEMVTHGVTVRSTDARSWASQVHWGLPASAQGISRHAWSLQTARMMLCMLVAKGQLMMSSIMCSNEGRPAQHGGVTRRLRAGAGKQHLGCSRRTQTGRRSGLGQCLSCGRSRTEGRQGCHWSATAQAFFLDV